MIKYWYESGLCHVLHYSGLNPVEYETNENNMYEKRKMVCTNKTDDCQAACEVWEKSPEFIKPSDIWKMRDTKL